MKKKLLFLCTLLTMFTALCAQESGKMYVRFLDDSEQNYSLQNISRLDISNADSVFIFLKDGSRIAYLNAGVEMVSFWETKLPPVGKENTLLESKEKISVFPNPTEGELNISCEGGVIQHLYIFDASGKEMLRTAPKGKTATLQIASFPKGIYLLKVETRSGVVTKKFIKN